LNPGSTKKGKQRGPAFKKRKSGNVRIAGRSNQTPAPSVEQGPLETRRVKEGGGPKSGGKAKA